MLCLVDYKQFIFNYWFSFRFLFSSQNTPTVIQSISFYFYTFVFFIEKTALQRRHDNNGFPIIRRILIHPGNWISSFRQVICIYIDVCLIISNPEMIELQPIATTFVNHGFYGS